MEQVKCFTDASYSQQKGLSVIGYKIGENEIVLDRLPGVKNTQAELVAIDRCISECNRLYSDNVLIIIHTDCQRALKNQYVGNVLVVKIKGHKKKVLRDEDDAVFSTVDKAVRRMLRRS